MSEDLPVILVSAADATTAEAVISELIGDEASEEQEGFHVWRISNKYYTARVAVQALVDGAAAPGPLAPARLHAHLLHLAAHECSADVLRRRAARAGAEAAGVRLVLCAAPAPEPLLAAAHALHYEPVSLQARAPPPPAGPFPELVGMARVREALHTHVWPGMSPRRAEPAPAAPADEEEDEAECVRRASLLAEALGALQTARVDAHAPREERLLRAEQLVRAFCDALGTDLDAL